jgi:cell fate regulator YaaT (PSP1 superfamily)
MKKIKIVGIQFKSIGKVYNFNPTDIELSLGDQVVVETIRGVELGKVADTVREIESTNPDHEHKPILRKATPHDLAMFEENKNLAKTNLVKFKKFIKVRNLPMKALECEYTLDRQKILFYYGSDERVDFRELLKDLATEFKVRIELRQVGPREGARFIGGIGTCGRKLCCKEHMRDFEVITMKMAKDQNMNLNSSKITGACGKLLCCIAHENSIYQEVKNRLPEVDDMVKVPGCDGCRVVGVDLLRELIRIDDGKNNIVVHPSKDIEKIISGRRKKNETPEPDATDLEG